ncbi:MAG: hypothetical protein EB084_12690 [Proteobacteria bacterium]|nr:hypothetical protein [Pseudomonadota bacterium]
MAALTVAEDGPTSERAVFGLMPPPKGACLRVSGVVPLIGNAAPETPCIVKMNGHPAAALLRKVRFVR